MSLQDSAKELAKVFEEFENAYIDEDKTVRWKSNNRCPFEDMLDSFMKAGLISEFSFARTNLQRESEAQIAINEYIQMREQEGYSQEEKIEMRNAFGDQKVIDVFTGKQVNL